MRRLFVIIVLCCFLETALYGDDSNLLPYWELLQKFETPKIGTEYQFPVSVQFKNGCFGFAVKHIVQYKYRKTIDLLEAEKRIKKPGKDLWTNEHIKNFLESYHLKLRWYDRADIFFYLLASGEPVMIQYKYHTGNSSWVGHFVAVYSFDSNGVYISESIKGKRVHLSYNEIFDTSGKRTQFAFATVEQAS